VVVVAFLAFLAWWLWLPSQLSEGGETFLKVANQTDQVVTVVQLGGDGMRSEVAEVPAHSTVETFLPCGSAELIAVDEQGSVVARRPASEECNLTTWVVRP
jgi:hypothetical protein